MTATLDDEVAQLRQAIAELQGRLDERTRERDEALAREVATAEVLEVINSSFGDTQPTFDAIAASATRLCGAASGAVFRFDGSQSHLAAHYNCSPAELDALRATYPLAPSWGSVTGRAILTRAVAYVADIATDPEYALPSIVQSGMHAHLSVPMLLDGNPVGAITVARREATPFSEAQIELLKTFAAEAMIAMEHARLLTETREALDQQTATTEVLQVINSSPGNLPPVFDAMLEKAMYLCEAAFGVLWTYDGERLHAVAMHGVPSAFADFAREPLHPGLETGLGRVLQGERLIHIADIRAGAIYPSGDRLRVATVELAGARTLLLVPLRKDDVLLGIFSIYRQEVRPFTDKQIALLQNFAAQAVIAMENARLITETQQALDQQTATAEVLQVINASPGDLSPVFDAMLEKAMRLCEAAFGVMHTYDGKAVHPVALRGLPPPFAEFASNPANQPGPGGATPRLMRGERIVHVIDLKKEEAYRSGDPYRRALVDLGGARTLLAVPLRKDGTSVGQIAVYRQEVCPYTEKQIVLLENFAAQVFSVRRRCPTRSALLPPSITPGSTVAPWEMTSWT